MLMRELMEVLQVANRFFERSGMYSYTITSVEPVSNNEVRITFREISPSRELYKPFTLSFIKRNGELKTLIPTTSEDYLKKLIHEDIQVFDEETIRYIRFGK